jgi:uncharacterized membrane protein YdbT with pleckstrin-like domain
MARYEYLRAEAPSTGWKRIAIITLGIILIPVGMALWFLPGPGWLTIFAGLALLAGQWKRTSRMLDRTELRLRRMIERLRRSG